MRHNSFSYIISLAFAILLSVLTDSRAYSQNYWCRANEISWSHGSTDTKQFTIRSQDSLAFVVNASACPHFYVQTDERNYTVTIIPFSINNAQVDIVQNLYVTIDDYGTPVTETVVLRHCAAPAPPDPDPNPDPGPDPEPEPDPWDAITVDLPDTLSWIQRTTVTSADGSSYYRDVTFYDGLGYPSQEVLVGASPGGLKSIYTPVVYDAMRRADATVYLPYAAPTAAQVHDGDAIVRQSGFYSLDPYRDSRPYAETVYETSPEGRPLFSQREGHAWDADGGHRSNFIYRTNTADDAVPKYIVLPGTNKATCEGVWAEGTLHCTEAVDEASDTVRTWTDAFGKTVLTETGTWTTLPGGDVYETARTLYIYDLRDSLAMVVQPEGVKALCARPAASRNLSITPGSNSDNGDITDKYCFVWSYDGRGNVLSEHTPGGGMVQYAYDARNRRVIQTDSLMSPVAGAGGRMILTLHDQYDRIVEERYVSSPQTSFEALRQVIRDTVSHTMAPSLITYYLPTIKVLRSAEYFPFGSFSYATFGDGAFTSDSGVAVAADLETERIGGFLRQETVYPAPNPDGTVSPGAPSVTRYYHYDYRGRVIQTKEFWSDGRARRISTKYSFTGDVLATKETVIIPLDDGIQTHESSLATFYTRDPRGRVLTCSRVLDGTDTLATVHYAYDELGRLSGKTVGDTNFPLLETYIDYDLHGWTTAIDVAVADEVSGSMNAVFSETLSYADTLKDASACRYDGNIAETAFAHRVDGPGGTPYLQTDTWSYFYDGLKRLTDASHYPGAALTPSLTDTERGIVYDLNGNITTLKRYGSSGLENNLTFTHTGNRMTSLSDANASGNDAGTKSFTYDANGNMTSDGRKGLELTWNVLNLVDSAAMHGSSLKYAWLSDGTKVSAKADDGSGNGVQKRYLGSFVLTSNTEHSADKATEVESIAWDEGRIFFDVPIAGLDGGDLVIEDTTAVVVDSLTAWINYYRDCWFAGDHLGNVRSVIDITPGLGGTQVLEQSNYLPYGTRIQGQYFRSAMADNRWRYAGKEEQDFTPFSTLNLSLLDFGARMYDPFTARWTAVDPMAGKDNSTSPYVYCAENPVCLSDPTGLEGIVVSGQPGDHNNRTHFLENGLDRAMKLLKEYKSAGSGETVTWFIFSQDNAGGYNEETLENYTKKAESLGIQVKTVDNAKSIISYINNKDGGSSRSDDLISDFVYIGHATPGDLDIGFVDHNLINMAVNETLNVSKFKSTAFSANSNANLVGGCKTAIKGNLLFEPSVASQMANKVGGTVKASNVRVYYPGGIVSDKQLVQHNHGEIIVFKGKKK